MPPLKILSQPKPPRSPLAIRPSTTNTAATAATTLTPGDAHVPSPLSRSPQLANATPIAANKRHVANRLPIRPPPSPAIGSTTNIPQLPPLPYIEHGTIVTANAPYHSSPNSHLIAVLLVTRTDTGPHLVYHYPPKPTPFPITTLHISSLFNANDEDNDHDDSDSDSDSDHGGARKPSIATATAATTTTSNTTPSDALGSSRNTSHRTRGKRHRPSSSQKSRGAGVFSGRYGEGEMDEAEMPDRGRNNSHHLTDARNRHHLHLHHHHSRPQSIPQSQKQQSHSQSLADQYHHHHQPPSTLVNLRQTRHLSINKDKEKEKDKQHAHEWETVLGLSTDALTCLLAPAQNFFEKHKFEVSLGPYVFLGAPRFVNEDGSWKKPRPKSASRSRSRRAHRRRMTRENDKAKEKEQEEQEKVKEKEKEQDRQSPEPTSAKPKPKPQPQSKDKDSHYPPACTLSMFNVVFVTRPAPLQHHEKVSQLFRHVIRHVGKNLKYAQSHNDYVYEQTKLITSLKTKAEHLHTPMSTLYQQISQQSTLARALQIIFNQLLNDQIAHVDFGLGFDVSYQIPQLRVTRFAPNPNRPQDPSGLWLTTASELVQNDEEPGAPNTASTWVRTRTLLLLQDEAEVLKELKGQTELENGTNAAAPLVHLLNYLTATKPLIKIAKLCSMSIEDVEQLARYLIRWSKAREVPPLHHRDAYIVSPTANSRRLETDSKAFAATFPQFMSLTSFLSKLSEPNLCAPDHTVPKLYSEYFEDGPYLRHHHHHHHQSATANATTTTTTTTTQTLVSNAAVTATTATAITPLQPYSRSQRKREFYMDVITWLLRHGWVVQLRTFAWLHVPSSVKAAVYRGLKELHPPLVPNADDLAMARLMEQTASDTANLDADATKAAATSVAGAPAMETAFPASIITEIRKIGALESRWLDCMRAQLRDTGLKGQYWPHLIKYFDGRQALEEIGAREGIKRKRVEGMIKQLVDMGFLLVVRHW